MNNNLQVYSNNSFSVRTITDADGVTQFVAKDVAEELEYEIDGGIGKYVSHVPGKWKVEHHADNSY